jgi:Leucine-rich repeat (LRR) protein
VKNNDQLILDGSNQYLTGGANFNDSKFQDLKVLDLSENQITSLNISNLSQLKYLNLTNSFSIKVVDISHNSKLE